MIVDCVNNDQERAPRVFEVRDPRLPPYWEFKYFVIEGSEHLGRRAVWGYSALVNDPGHNSNLHYTDNRADGVAEDLKIFRDEVARRNHLGY